MHYHYRIKSEAADDAAGLACSTRAVAWMAREIGVADRWLRDDDAARLFSGRMVTKNYTAYDKLLKDWALIAKKKASIVDTLVSFMELDRSDSYAVVALSSGAPRRTDVEETALEIQLSLGAYGMEVLRSHFPKYRNHILVRVTDMKLARESAKEMKRYKDVTPASGAWPYGFLTTVHFDSHLNEPKISSTEVDEILNSAAYKNLPETVRMPRRRSNIVHDGAARYINLQLDCILKMLNSVAQ